MSYIGYHVTNRTQLQAVVENLVDQRRTFRGSTAYLQRWAPWRWVEAMQILHVDLSADLPAEQALARKWLSDEEVARWQRFRHERPSRPFAFSRAALRATLCEQLGCRNDDLEFGFHGYGKPFALVRGRVAPTSFNLSHSGDHGLVALGPRGQLGIDVEARVPGRDFVGIGESVFGPNELRNLLQARDAERDRVFYRLWTHKEALIKALGIGFSLSPSRFEVPASMLHGLRSSVVRFPHAPASAWRLEDLGEPRFAAAIAYRLPPSPHP